MKPALIVILSILCLTAFTQKRDNFWLKQGINAGCFMVGGFMFRRAEIAKDDFRRYQAIHPNTNPQWSNPKLSYRNKYKNWPEDQEPAYFLSTSVLVFTTDQFHMDNLAGGVAMVAGMGVSLTLYEKPNFKQILLQCGISLISYTSGRALADIVYPKID